MDRTDRGGARPRPLTGERQGQASSSLPRLMLVTDRRETRGRDLVDVVEAAVAGGVRLVQVRERDLSETEIEALLQRLVARLRGVPLRLLVNGHPTIAERLEIGLHLPASAPLSGAPRPPLLGRAVHDETEARRALAEGASYAVVGPVFPTGSKPGHPGAGLVALARLVRIVAPMPVFAIGGLTPGRVPDAREAGAHGVAVRSAILGAADPRLAARAFAEVLALTWGDPS